MTNTEISTGLDAILAASNAVINTMITKGYRVEGAQLVNHKHDISYRMESNVIVLCKGQPVARFEGVVCDGAYPIGDLQGVARAHNLYLSVE